MSVNPVKKIINDWGTIIIACITIGLAPFTPEPHILGKLRWVAGGAVGMRPLDWFDLFLHGTPWLLLLRLIAIEIFKKIKTP
jgi:hypothetical protein